MKRNNVLNEAFNKLKSNKYDGYLFYLANENLYEYTEFVDNYVVELTGFTGDTGIVLVSKNVAYLLVDGRFTIQAKKEINDKRIKVVDIYNGFNELDFIVSKYVKKARIGVDPKRMSIKKYNDLIEKTKSTKIEVVCDEKFLKKELIETKKECFNMTKAPLFLLDKQYVSKTSKEKIKEVFENEDLYYVTSSLEEIAYLTNLRYRFCDINNHNVLFNSFMIINKKHSILYVKDYLEDDAIEYILKNNIEIKDYDCFYDDVKKIKNKKNILLDDSINNYYVYKYCNFNSDNIAPSPLKVFMSIKNDKEIKNMRETNIIDGVAITKALYNVKTKKYKNEYEVKMMVDKMRTTIGGDKYLCPSFETIVAYKENSAICHYSPKKESCKNLANDSVLLIDSGGQYLCGTTDITRTISLYKNKKQIPNEIKKYYTMVLNAMLSLAMQKINDGTTGSELDIIARASFYNEYLDFNHGTGHGIGYISNVHEGPNRIGPGILRDYKDNVLRAGQVMSDEPGLYFENKYGIRIENDILVKKLKTNEYGTFLGFEMLTICPFDMDLIDKQYLDEKVVPYLNDYNKFVYNTLSPYMDENEKKWLKSMTMEIKK